MLRGPTISRRWTRRLFLPPGPLHIFGFGLRDAGVDRDATTEGRSLDADSCWENVIKARFSLPLEGASREKKGVVQFNQQVTAT